MTIDQLGYIRNPKNRSMGQYTKEGQYITKKRAVAATVKDGAILDRYGKEAAVIMFFFVNPAYMGSLK